MLHPIFAFILCGNLVEVAVLIGINPEAVRVTNSRWYNATPASVDEVNDWKETALHSSCQFGHLELTKLLLQHGASVHKLNKNNQTPLHLAARYGHVDILAWILDNYNFDMKMKDFQGLTSLHTAALNGQSSCYSVILQHRPDLNIKAKNGNTPLALACQTGQIETVRSLLQHGAGVSHNRNGYSPLHIAAMINHADVVEMMVKEYRWDVNIVSIWMDIKFNREV